LEKKTPKFADEDEDLYINLEVVCFYACKTKIYMIDSDQCSDSNRRPLFKSTDVIISNHGPIKGYSQIGVFSKFSDLWPIYWLGLGNMSVTSSLDIDLRK